MKLKEKPQKEPPGIPFEEVLGNLQRLKGIKEEVFEANGGDMPLDQNFLQLKSKEKFLGSMLWDAFNLMTFGAFEKKPGNHRKNSTTNSNNTASSAQTQQQQSQPQQQEEGSNKSFWMTF